jgi:hypothetical protein
VKISDGTPGDKKESGVVKEAMRNLWRVLKKTVSTGNPIPIFILLSLLPLAVLIELLTCSYTYDVA